MLPDVDADNGRVRCRGAISKGSFQVRCKIESITALKALFASRKQTVRPQRHDLHGAADTQARDAARYATASPTQRILPPDEAHPSDNVQSNYSLSSGSWLGVVMISSFLVAGL